MDFFSECNSAEDTKLLYHKLAKIFHPDRGGDKDMMAELNAQYDKWEPISTIQDDNRLHEARNTIARQDKQLTEYKSACNMYKKLYDELSYNMQNERNMYNNSLQMRDRRIEKLQTETKDLEFELSSYENMTIWQRIKFLLYPEYGKDI